MREGVKPAEISDYDLSQKIVCGDVEAFKQIYTRHRSYVYNLCKKITGVEDAEDTAQKTWTQVYRKVGDFRNDSKFTTWLYRIIVNICLRHVEKNKREITVSEEQWRIFENPEIYDLICGSRTPPSPEAVLEQKIKDELFDKFATTLNADDKIIVIKRLKEELKPREIAPLLDRDYSPEDVSNQFGRLMKRFKKFICNQERKGGDTKI